MSFLSHPSSGQPPFFRQELENQKATEGDSIALRCELSKPGIRVEWRKGGVVLQPSKKHEMKQEGCVQELHVHDLEPEDNGYYTCDAGDQLTTASVTVQGIKYQSFQLVPNYLKVIYYLFGCKTDGAHQN